MLMNEKYQENTGIEISPINQQYASRGNKNFEESAR
jgi:hypothetical protein